MTEKNLKGRAVAEKAIGPGSRGEATFHPTGSSQREFVFSRTVDAPRDLVYKVWTEADHLAKWWGPKGFKMLSCTVDLRSGGLFHYGMKSPDGSEMWGKFVYRAIKAPELLEFIVSFSDKNGGTNRHPMAPTWPLEMLNIVTFTPQGNRTLITLRGSAHNASDLEIKTYLDNFKSMEKGFGGTFEQLEAYLAEAQGKSRRYTDTVAEATGRVFVLRRSFEAPRDLVFSLWTKPEHLSKWWGPRLMSVPVADIDFRPGGSYRIVMRGSDGVDYPMRGHYQEIKRPERFTFTCNLDEHPDEWFALLDKTLNGATRQSTLAMVITVTFAETNGRTEVEVHTLFESEAVRDAMASMGMKDGWSQSFERLDDLLAEMK